MRDRASRRGRPGAASLAVAIALVSPALSASPEEPPGSAPVARAVPTGAERPWAANVSPERQADAQRRFEIGNRSFEESKYGEALASYREALRFWDHPVIHFNMAVCLIHLDQPVEAHEHLTLAMRYGAGPLGDELHSQGLTYDKLLSGRLARIRISCQQPGVEVSLDGRPILTCPETSTRVVLPGRHQIVARKPGHLTDARDVVLLPGKLHQDRIALAPVVAKSVVARRWRVWVPWVVVGSGAALAGLGYGLHRRARSTYDEYDGAFAAACPAGCLPADVPAAVDEIAGRARRENNIAIAAMSAGAAAVTAGAVLVFLNQPRAISEAPPGARLTPLLGGDAAGLAITLPF